MIDQKYISNICVKLKLIIKKEIRYLWDVNFSKIILQFLQKGGDKNEFR